MNGPYAAIAAVHPSTPAPCLAEWEKMIGYCLNVDAFPIPLKRNSTSITATKTGNWSDDSGVKRPSARRMTTHNNIMIPAMCVMIAPPTLSARGPAPINVVRAEDEAATRENRKPRRIISPELRKLYDALGLNEELRPDSTMAQSDIEWVRIHTLPDFASFDHRAHVGAGVDCQTCHGEVQTMERVRQVSTLSMGWCVNCHRDANAGGIKGKKVDAPLDCIACHY